MRAQAEFIAVIAVAAIVILSVYLGFSFLSASSVPQAVAADQRDVRVFVETIVRDVSVDIIKLSEKRGGFLLPEDATVFSLEPVGYWQKCEQDLVPNKIALESHLAGFIKGITAARLNGLQNISGRNVSLDLFRASAKVAIFDSRIDVTFFLPTNVSGYAIRDPYTVSIPSRYGRIYNFGKDFVAQAVKPPEQDGRPFEAFTSNAILFSSKLPTNGMLSICGETIFLTPDEISRRLEDIVRHVVTGVRWWEPMIKQVGSALPKVYAIDKVNGNTYPDLDIQLKLNDGFKIEQTTPIVLTNTRLAYTGPVGAVSGCTRPYQVAYTIAYPLIVTVRDPLLNNDVRFATFVSADNTVPATGDSCGSAPPSTTCSWEPQVQPDESTKMVWACHDPVDTSACATSGCKVRLKVTDTANNPLPNSFATFGTCYLGPADNKGIIEGPTVCASSDLNIYESSGKYDFINKPVDAASASGTYRLPKVPNVKIAFTNATVNRYTFTYQDERSAHKPTKTVIVAECAVEPVKTSDNFVIARLTSATDPSKEYSLTTIDPAVAEQATSNPICQKCTNGETQNDCNLCSSLIFSSTLPSVSVSYVPEGTYQVQAELREGREMVVHAVAGAASFPISATDSQEVFVTLYDNPTLREKVVGTPLTPIRIEQKVYETGLAMNIQNSTALKAACGIDPVTTARPLTTIRVGGDYDCTTNGINLLMDTYKTKGCLAEPDIESVCPQPQNQYDYPSCAADINKVKDLLLRKCSVRAEFEGCGVLS